MAMQPQKMGEAATLVDVIDRILDKGVVINADIKVNLVGVELLEIKLRAALASFETAAKYGMEFPTGINTSLDVWKKAQQNTEACPQCQKRSEIEVLLTQGCLWCGWKSPKAEQLASKLSKTKKTI